MSIYFDADSTTKSVDRLPLRIHNLVFAGILTVHFFSYSYRYFFFTYSLPCNGKSILTIKFKGFFYPPISLLLYYRCVFYQHNVRVERRALVPVRSHELFDTIRTALLSEQLLCGPSQRLQPLRSCRCRPLPGSESPVLSQAEP